MVELTGTGLPGMLEPANMKGHLMTRITPPAGNPIPSVSDGETRPASATSTYEVGYYYTTRDATPLPGTVPAEDVILTITGTWKGNLMNAVERMLTELDEITHDEMSFRPEKGKLYRACGDELADGVNAMIIENLDLPVGEAHYMHLDQDIADGDDERIVIYVLRTA